MLFVPGKLRLQTAELVHGAIHLAPRPLAVAAVYLLRGAGQPPAGPIGYGRHHLQVALQLGRG
jgi:hypothetical protein